MQKLKESLQNIFEKSNLTIQSGSIKCHTKTIDINQLNSLYDLSRNGNVLDLNIKRSGSGLTIIINF